MKAIMCKKRQIMIDKELEKCNECIKKSLSGFVDKETCEGFNLNYVEVKDDLLSF